MVPAATPQTKPAATRVSVASAWVCNSPVRARSVKVVQITEGGGTRRPLERPIRTAISQNMASATGSRKPSAGRAQRAGLAFDAACSSPGCSAVAVTETRDITLSATATEIGAHDRHPRAGRAADRRGNSRNVAAARTSDPCGHLILRGPRKVRGRLRTMDRDRTLASIRHRDVTVIDEIVDRFLDVHVGADHARLL